MPQSVGTDEGEHTGGDDELYIFTVFATESMFKTYLYNRITFILRVIAIAIA